MDLNSLRSKKRQYRETASGGTGILANLLKNRQTMSPNQIRRLVKNCGFDIRAKDNENKYVLHYAARGGLTAEKLRMIGELLDEKTREDEELVVDRMFRIRMASCPARSGSTAGAELRQEAPQ